MRGLRRCGTFVLVVVLVLVVGCSAVVGSSSLPYPL
jgi:hypothetical protein